MSIDFRQAYLSKETVRGKDGRKLASGHVQGALVHHYPPTRPLAASEARDLAAFYHRLAMHAEAAQYRKAGSDPGTDGPTGGTPVAAAAN